SAPAAASGSSMAAVPTVAEPAPVEASDAPASLSLKDEAYSEKVGDQPDEEHSKVELPGATLTNEEIFRIVREVARADSGDAMYSAISADREFAAPAHAAYQKRHFGLGFGLLLYTQESGRLGALLHLMKDRDPEKFGQIFGPDSESLLQITNADSAE